MLRQKRGSSNGIGENQGNAAEVNGNKDKVREMFTQNFFCSAEQISTSARNLCCEAHRSRSAYSQLAAVSYISSLKTARATQLGTRGILQASTQSAVSSLHFKYQHLEKKNRICYPWHNARTPLDLGSCHAGQSQVALPGGPRRFGLLAEQTLTTADTGNNLRPQHFKSVPSISRQTQLSTPGLQ